MPRALPYHRPIAIASIDHAAIPTDRPDEMIAFYRGLGFAVVGEEAWRDGSAIGFAFALGDSKINVHGPSAWRDARFTLRGPTAVPGCGDFCFVWTGTVDDAVELLTSIGAAIEVGPVDRVGGRSSGTATGRSVYTRDPDGNLLELITYPDPTAGAAPG
ncbi:MAG: VOC family protein [Ilumatobacteraceae bacterium]